MCALAESRGVYDSIWKQEDINKHLDIQPSAVFLALQNLAAASHVFGPQA